MRTSITELANHLHKKFATDQTVFALQHDDGSYRKRTGIVTPQLLTDILTGGLSPKPQKFLTDVNTMSYVK